MKSITYRQGDLLAAGLPAWGHGVNLDGVMGSGIARQVKAEYPEVFKAYRAACHPHALDKLNPGNAQMVRAQDGTRVFNIASQIQQGPNARYGLLYRGVTHAAHLCSVNGIDKLGLPQIGCGIGGLRWDVVEALLNEIQSSFEEVDIEVFVL